MSRLVYVVGASGAGKDSVMSYARARLAGHPVVFAHRYITRPAAAGGENHVALTDAEFLRRRSAGCFVMDWASHGHLYGVGCEIVQWLAADLVVVANGSRAYLPVARLRVPGLLAVEISAAPEALAERLAQRGRESAKEIDARLLRARMAADDRTGLTVIDNSGPLAVAGTAFVGLLQATMAKASEVA